MNTSPTKTASSAGDDREEKTATDETAAPAATHTDDVSADAVTDAVPGAEDDDADLEPAPYAEAEAAASAGVGAGAAAIVSVALGIVSLTGAWTGRVAAERETLIGQLNTASGGSPAQQIAEIYGDGWHTTALVGGLFAVVALLVGAFVLVRPAFGRPAAHPQPSWIRAVAMAGVALGVIGVLISVGMYFDLFVPLPTAPPAPTAG